MLNFIRRPGRIPAAASEVITVKLKKNVRISAKKREKKPTVKWGYLLFFFIALVLFAAFVISGILLGDYIESLRASGELCAAPLL